MRVEALWFLLVGAPLFTVAFLASRFLGSPRLRRLTLAASFGFTLGLGFVPAHGEVVVAPVLAFLTKGGVVAVAGVIYGLLCCACVLVASQFLDRHRLRRAQ